jgi:hypothetical protein
MASRVPGVGTRVRFSGCFNTPPRRGRVRRIGRYRHLRARVEGCVMLEFTAVRKSFGSRPVLNGVDLVIGPGEALALVGGNGSGKTTTMRCGAACARRPCGGRSRRRSTAPRRLPLATTRHSRSRATASSQFGSGRSAPHVRGRSASTRRRADRGGCTTRLARAGVSTRREAARDCQSSPVENLDAP